MMRREMERELLSRPVRALQYMLNQLSLVYDFMPTVGTSGMFDENTLEAVMTFQREFSPPVTGVVDRRTWQAIQKKWEEAEAKLEEPRPVRAYPGNGRQTEPGEWKEYMALPQTMFQSLAHYFNGIGPSNKDGMHDKASADNVRWLQRAAGLKPNGTLDQPTWNMLSRLYETFVIPEGVLPDEMFPSWG